MNVVYSEMTKQWAEGFALLQQATAILEEAVDASEDRVKAEWSVGIDSRGQPIYMLVLSDWAGSVSGHFTPDDLRDRHLRIRLYPLWSALLRERNHKQLQEFQSSGE